MIKKFSGLRREFLAAAVIATFLAPPLVVAQSTKVLKLGGLLTVTGPNASLGKEGLGGLEYAAKLVNAVGGVKITEPGADLAVLLAIVSSLKNKPLTENMVVFGEVGLAGEVRPVQRGQERLKEAAKLGFTSAIIPKANKPKQSIPGIEIIAVERVEEAVSRMR